MPANVIYSAPPITSPAMSVLALFAALVSHKYRGLTILQYSSKLQVWEEDDPDNEIEIVPAGDAFDVEWWADGVKHNIRGLMAHELDGAFSAWLNFSAT